MAVFTKGKKKYFEKGYPEDSKREMTKIGEYSQN